MTSQLPIAVDAMGSDSGTEVIVAAAKRAVLESGASVLLVGDPDAIGDTGGIPVLAASEVIGMHDEPASSIRRKKDSSVVRAAEAVRDGQAAAMLSAGNTGAAMAASLLRMGRIRGISRPAIAVPFPVLGSTPTTLLDCGANADVAPEWLLQFAQMGTVYSRARWGTESPRVGIMTIGEEAGKGNALVKEACTLFETEDWASKCGATYVGNLEGRDLMTGVADVIVTDGFTGNVILKSLEGGVKIALDAVRSVLSTNAETQAAAEVLNPLLEPVFDELDPETRGSAALLGTRGVTLIAHGSSTEFALANAIVTAQEMVQLGIVDRVRELV